MGTPTCKLANFCDKMLKLITTNEYTIKDSFSLAKEGGEYDPNFVKASSDIKSRFTNIPLTKSIDICIENLYRDQTYQ